MLKLVSSQVVKKDGKYVVQKYIGKYDSNMLLSFAMIFAVFQQRHEIFQANRNLQNGLIIDMGRILNNYRIFLKLFLETIYGKAQHN